MKKYIIILLKCILILWGPILLIEETFLFDYISSAESFICSIIISILCLIMYMKTYKKVKKEKINCYIYNIANTILLVIMNVALGYLFTNLVNLKLFHHCMESGWDCFLEGIEYLLIGLEYAFLSIIILIVWLFVRFIKFLNTK